MSKVCTSCGIEKHISRFSSYDNGYGLKVRNTCKDCRNSRIRGTRTESSKRYYLNNIPLIRQRKRQYYYGNREALQDYSTRYYEANRELVSLRVAAKAYGISIEEAKELRSGTCFICGSDGSEYKKSLHIDHCHTTGKVRGALCHSCNIALGLIKEDINILDKMKEYLVAFSETK